jgi:hypothetical protein
MCNYIGPIYTYDSLACKYEGKLNIANKCNTTVDVNITEQFDISQFSMRLTGLNIVKPFKESVIPLEKSVFGWLLGYYRIAFVHNEC